MAVDVLILNTAVCDLRRPDFNFTDELVGQGGLAKGKTSDMPDYSQDQLSQWIGQGSAVAGGFGNTAPLIARTGLKVAGAANFGKGPYQGLDAQGRFFHDVMAANDVDMSSTFIHPDLPTGTAFIHDTATQDRGGIVYFPNANDDFDFARFGEHVERLEPKIVYYMYSGLSKRGDANNGKDLADFIKWCRQKDIVTIIDSHTLTGNPQQLINQGSAVKEYRLLEPLLPEVDLFFTSSDEAKMIENTLAAPRNWCDFSEDQNNTHFLEFLAQKYMTPQNRTALFGVTVSSGAFQMHKLPDGTISPPKKVQSKFMAGEVIDLVGAGDSFRAGLITYIARHLEQFKSGTIDFNQAIQMANLFASLYIKAPLTDRYANIKPYEKLLAIVQSDKTYSNFDQLINALQ